MNLLAIPFQEPPYVFKKKCWKNSYCIVISAYRRPSQIPAHWRPSKHLSTSFQKYCQKKTIISRFPPTDVLPRFPPTDVLSRTSLRLFKKFPKKIAIISGFPPTDVLPRYPPTDVLLRTPLHLFKIFAKKISTISVFSPTDVLPRMSAYRRPSENLPTFFSRKCEKNICPNILVF